MKTMIKILFLIHDLGHGGAEKVLVNLVNNMDCSKFDISVISLFGGGINEQFLKKNIHYRCIWKKGFPGNSKFMKLLTPQQLHTLCVKEYYDIEVSYLEGPSARVTSGCLNPYTKLVSWIHVEQHTMDKLAASFRSKKEAQICYSRFDETICVSQCVHDDFCRLLNLQKPCTVLYNTVESDKILAESNEPTPELLDTKNKKLVAVGTLKQSKGYMRLLEVIKRLKEEQYPIHLYILGIGPLQQKMQEYIYTNSIEDAVTLLGYQTNPYKYVGKCDLFVCASFAEGFSTAVTESLIVGTPVCTVNVSGMKELLGQNNEYGLVVENTEEALYQGIKRFFVEPEMLKHYAEQAKIRGKDFSKEKTVQSVEKKLIQLYEEKYD